MQKEIYLELSQENGSAHKFYQINIKHNTVEINYGRIGLKGSTQVKTLSSFEEAKLFADKKANAKQKKGYLPATKGVRKFRPIRPVVRRISSPYANNQTSTASLKAPVIAKFKTNDTAFGIFVNDKYIYIGDETGRISVLNHSYQLVREFKLPAGTKCIVGDGPNVFAGTDQGQVYELTGSVARLAYDFPGESAIFWMDLCDGVLAVSDNEGGLFAYDFEGESLFQTYTRNGKAWMVRVDETSIYHGGNHIARYTFEGELLWKNPTTEVLFGYQTKSCIYAGSNGVVMIDKHTGKKVRSYPANWVPSNCTNHDGSLVFCQDRDQIKAWNKKGEQLFALNSPNSGMSMQYFDEKLFIVGDSGLGVVDVSDLAISDAKKGKLIETKVIYRPKDTLNEVDSSHLEKTNNPEGGIELVCTLESGKHRIKVVSEGYDQSLNCQFPKNLRKEGRRYLVHKIELSKNKLFYRISGDILELS